MRTAKSAAARSGLISRFRHAVSLNDSGAEAIEMALVLPVFLLFLIGALDVGRMAWTQGTLDYATSAAARCASLDRIQCSTIAQTQAYAATHAYGLTIQPSAFAVTPDACGRRVSVELPFALVTPYILARNFTLAANACYPAQS